MARISTYNLDTSIDGSERLISSNPAGTTTENVTVDAIASWLNSHGVIGIAGQSNFRLQTIEGDGRENGTVSLPSFGGNNTAFSSLTTLRFSALNAANNDVSPYLLSLVTEVVILFQLDNISNFGIYSLSALEQVNDTLFYDATLTLERSNGNLVEDKVYGFAIYPSTTIQPTPTLDNVTDEGAVTNNSIEVGGLTVTGAFKNYDEATPDIGAKQDNDLRGYGDGYISDKTLAFVRLSEQAKEEDGAIRIKDNIFQTYISGAWQDVVTNFRFREDGSGSYELEHKPVGFTQWIEVLSGNSDLLGLNGLPITQNYATSMGAFPVPLQLDGGTF